MDQMTEELSFVEDRARVANRSVKKIREMAIYKDATRAECLEGIIYEMAAKIDQLKLTLNILYEDAEKQTP